MRFTKWLAAAAVAVSANDTGPEEFDSGWKGDPDFLERFADLECNIETLEPWEMDEERFNRDYLHKRPVLFRPTEFEVGQSPWFVRTGHYTREGMLKRWGHREMHYEKSERIVAQKGNVKLKLSLKEIIEEKIDEGYYLFMAVINHPKSAYARIFKEISAQVNFPHFDEYRARGKKNHKMYFIVGGSETGAGWHAHWDAWLTQIYNHKMVLIYPHAQKPPYHYAEYTYSNIHMEIGKARSGWQWYRDIFTRLDAEDRPPFQCLLQPNDLLYIPDQFWHLAVNVGESVSVSMQGHTLYTDDWGWMSKAHADFKEPANAKSFEEFQTTQEAALKKADWILEQFPEHSEAMQIKAFAYRDTRRREEALEAFEEILKIRPHNVNVVMNYANTLVNNNYADLVTPSKIAFALRLLTDLEKFDSRLQEFLPDTEAITEMGAAQLLKALRRAYGPPKKRDAGTTPTPKIRKISTTTEETKTEEKEEL